MPVMTEQYLRMQTVKTTGHLEDMFTDTHLIRHNRAFNTYTACIQVNIYHSDKSKYKMQDQQNRGISGDKDMTDGRQDHGNRYESQKTKVMQSKQKHGVRMHKP